MGDEYEAAVRKFYEVYRPMQERYNLRSHMRFSLHGGGLIEIWRYREGTREKCILRVQEANDTECYKRAIEDLENYEMLRAGKAQEKQHSKNRCYTDPVRA